MGSSPPPRTFIPPQFRNLAPTPQTEGPIGGQFAELPQLVATFTPHPNAVVLPSVSKRTPVCPSSARPTSQEGQGPTLFATDQDAQAEAEGEGGHARCEGGWPGSIRTLNENKQEVIVGAGMWAD